MRAYLDIETTFAQTISVIGIYRPDCGTIQLVGGGISDLALYDALDGVETIVTFNGASFDLPVIRKRLYVDLKQEFTHCDLLYVCRRRGLRGGLKKVETLLGIERATAGITGWDAPKLWHRYETLGDQAALDGLLTYNREDVINLAVLEDKIGLHAHPITHDGIRQILV
ncbi:MAG: ribonuclease H-like domain-containing protein [Roseiflexaceae bacterium]|nr:ribonuclease H-like domain-containing protein [Roseiflexaceae bacterium]